MRRRFRFGILPGLLSGLVLVPSLAAASAESLPEVVQPTAGALAVGGRLTIEWRSPAGRSDFSEWEAFLSLDDGATWPFRLTPHLDRAVRRFEAPLPPIASDRARLLLRFGDERAERELELPFRFRIAEFRDPFGGPPGVPLARRGERARSDSDGVVSWVEGRSDGRGWVVRRASDGGWGVAPERLSSAGADGLAVDENDPQPRRPIEASPDPSGRGPRVGAARASGAAPRAPANRNRLALLGRRNE